MCCKILSQTIKRKIKQLLKKHKKTYKTNNANCKAQQPQSKVTKFNFLNFNLIF